MLPGKYYRRVFKIRIPEHAKYDIEKFLERISKSIYSYGASIRLEGDSITIEIYGEKSMIRDSWIKLKALLSEYHKLSKMYPSKLLYKDVGLAIPLDVLAEILKLEGYKSEASREGLLSEAPYEEVIARAEAMKSSLEEAKDLYATRTAKKLLVGASALTGIPVSRVVEISLQSGLVDFDEDGKLILLKPWKEALRELVGLIRDEHEDKDTREGRE